MTAHRPTETSCPPPGRSGRSGWVPLGVAVPLAMAVASFVFGAILIHKFPVMYWGDPYARLENRDRVLVDRWLPLLQVLLDGINRLTPNVSTMRLVLSALGAMTVVAGYEFTARLFNVWSAAVFAILLATNPLFVALSIVPYQEVLFSGLLFSALALHVGAFGPRRPLATAILFNLACLTRYEGWVVVGLLASFEGIRARPPARPLAVAFATASRYGWTAPAWLLGLTMAHRLGILQGNHPPTRLGLGEWSRDYLHQLRGQVGNDALIVAAVAGVTIVCTQKKGARIHASLVLFVLASIGITFITNPYSVGNLRQTFLPVVFVLFYSAFGLVFILERIVGRINIRYRAAMLSVAIGILATGFALVFVPRAFAFVQAAANEPDARVVFEVAQRINTAAVRDRSRSLVVMLSTNELHAAVLATYTGLPRDRIVTSLGDRLPPETRYVVDIQLSSATAWPGSAAWRKRLESGAILARKSCLDSAVLWTIQEPGEK